MSGKGATHCDTQLSCRSGLNRRNHGPIVGAPMAPHIATPVSVESATQTAGAAAIAVTGNNTEAAAKVIAAKTITSANMTRAGRGTRIAVLSQLPPGSTSLP